MTKQENKFAVLIDAAKELLNAQSTDDCQYAAKLRKALVDLGEEDMTQEISLDCDSRGNFGWDVGDGD